MYFVEHPYPYADQTDPLHNNPVNMDHVVTILREHDTGIHFVAPNSTRAVWEFSDKETRDQIHGALLQKLCHRWYPGTNGMRLQEID